jgi:lipopolysaccharide transport system ATP-binding protein
MSRPVIEVRSLAKRYLLGAIGATSLREEASRVWDRLRGRPHPDEREFWALRDVSFDVHAGEVVGVIGRNGAGKSTLLKILSRITEPTTGRATLRGRVASLLEVGTGFHPELTGRENIFLNGAILGMNRGEIRRKFDEIVAFAEVEKFIDTPVKRYSSGMYVRLAFAVAAHLEPDLLIVDEVLAVGDMAFQKKCIDKMGQVAGQGRTILVVSHNMASVVNLCSRALLLSEGRLVEVGAVQPVVDRYLSSGGAAQGEVRWADGAAPPGNESVRLHAVRVWQDDPAQAQADVDIAKPITIEIQYWNLAAGEKYHAALWLADRTGTVVLASANHPAVSLTPDAWCGREHPVGLYCSRCTLPPNFLNEGLYRVTAIMDKGVAETQFVAEWILSFTVHDTGEMRKDYYGHWIGVVRPKLAWQTQRIESTSPPRHG